MTLSSRNPNPLLTCAKAALLVIIALAASLAFAASRADRAQADLAKRLGLKPAEVTLIKEEAVTWPDGALGLPMPEHFVIQMVIPGSVLVLEAGGTRYIYTASDNALKFGGPVPLWRHSLLYMEPRADDANGTSDLMQVSMMGTNPRLMLSRVSNFAPQIDGGIMAARRTSRSGFKLLYLSSGTADTPIELTGAFDFGCYAADQGGTHWAAVTRPTVGMRREIAFAPIYDAPAPKTVDLPDGKEPSRLLWKDGKLYAQVPTGWFSLDPDAAQPAWAAASEPPAEGDRPIKFSLTDDRYVFSMGDLGGARELTMSWSKKSVGMANFVEQSCTSVHDRWVVLTGSQDKKDAVYVVDTQTGLVVDALLGTYRSPAPFSAMPSVSDLLQPYVMGTSD
jgi:hypothetical protein